MMETEDVVSLLVLIRSAWLKRKKDLVATIVIENPEVAQAALALTTNQYLAQFIMKVIENNAQRASRESN